MRRSPHPGPLPSDGRGGTFGSLSAAEALCGRRDGLFVDDVGAAFFAAIGWWVEGRRAMGAEATSQGVLLIGIGTRSGRRIGGAGWYRRGWRGQRPRRCRNG